ncbi:hypothetical protein WME88_34900 [Sorangium sp. So ce216]
MTTYQMNFTLDTTSVGDINNAKQFITIVKSVGGGGDSTVAWLTFPAAQAIQVTWEEQYWLYATNLQYQAGAKINSQAITTSPVLASNLYTFNPDQLFSSAQLQTPNGSFQVDNQIGNNKWQFGLAQMASVNGSATPTAVPLNIVPVLNNQHVSFTPEVTVSVFTQMLSNNGVVISEVTGNPLTVNLTSAASSANLGYDDGTSTFNLLPQARTLYQPQPHPRLGALTASRAG